MHQKPKKTLQFLWAFTLPDPHPVSTICRVLFMGEELVKRFGYWDSIFGSFPSESIFNPAIRNLPSPHLGFSPSVTMHRSLQIHDWISLNVLALQNLRPNTVMSQSQFPTQFSEIGCIAVRAFLIPSPPCLFLFVLVTSKKINQSF